jgi:hypothetical protein
MSRGQADFLARSRRLDHLVIVAGPHGSGKTTLLKALVSGELPAEVASLFPAGARTWAQTSGRKTFAEAASMTERPAGSAAGLILHYNILRPPVRRIDSYNDDWVLRAIEGAERVTVVTLRPRLELLIGRFVQRATLEQSEAPGFTRARRSLRRLGHALARRLLPQALKHRLSLPDDSSSFSLSGGYGRVVQLYQQPGWLDGWYCRWDAFLACAADGGKQVRTFYLEPVARDGKPSFRLVSERGSPPCSSGRGLAASELPGST